MRNKKNLNNTEKSNEDEKFGIKLNHQNELM